MVASFIPASSHGPASFRTSTRGLGALEGHRPARLGLLGRIAQAIVAAVQAS